jgi:hypothetical protein
VVRAPLTTALCLLLVACNGDPNAKPIYGKETGLPVNCRAYVQAVVDGYRSKRYDADDSMAGLERNCGANGRIWGLTE